MANTLRFTIKAKATLDGLRKLDARRDKKVRKALRQISEDPSYQSLRTKGYDAITGPNGERAFESYVENNTPGAWRIVWCWGPGDKVITIVRIGHHD